MDYAVEEVRQQQLIIVLESILQKGNEQMERRDYGAAVDLFLRAAARLRSSVVHPVGEAIMMGASHLSITAGASDSSQIGMW